MFDGVGAFLPWIAIPLAAMSIVVLWRRGIFRLEPTGRTCTRRHDSAYYFVLFVIAILAQMIAARSVSMVGDDADHDVPRDAAESALAPPSEPNDDQHVERLRRGVTVGLPTSVLTIGVISLVVFVTDRGALGARPTASDAGQAIRLGAIGLVAVLPVYFSVAHVSGLLERLITGEPPASTSHDILESILQVGLEHPGLLLLVLLGAAVVTPVVEEAMYRFALQNALVTALRSGWWGIGATATLFAVMHLGVVPWRALPPLIVLGVAFGLVYERTGSFLAAVMMHGLFNALMIALTLLLGVATD
jgi:membrane protease YdiL (CAAX protease family)